MIGILAIHGDVAEHRAILDALKAKHRDVRTSNDLDGLTHLIIPGGESTVMSKFLFELSDLGKDIMRRVSEGSLAIYGTCAGAILLARKVTGHRAPRSLGLMNITVDRNAYGTQIQSFEAELTIKGFRTPLPAAFIRAPKITWVGNDVEVLAINDNDPVLVRSGRLLAGTFHPEARGETRIHRMFLKM